jgi:hypothetical protein
LIAGGLVLVARGLILCAGMILPGTWLALPTADVNRATCRRLNGFAYLKMWLSEVSIRDSRIALVEIPLHKIFDSRAVSLVLSILEAQPFDKVLETSFSKVFLY